MALGANRMAVLRMLLGQVALTVGVGLAIGLPATWMLTRIIASQLYGVEAHDPANLAMASAKSSRWRCWRPCCRRGGRRGSTRCARCGTSDG